MCTEMCTETAMTALFHLCFPPYIYSSVLSSIPGQIQRQYLSRPDGSSLLDGARTGGRPFSPCKTEKNCPQQMEDNKGRGGILKSSKKKNEPFDVPPSLLLERRRRAGTTNTQRRWCQDRAGKEEEALFILVGRRESDRRGDCPLMARRRRWRA